MANKKDFIWLYVSIGCFFLMAASFLLMPLDFTTYGIPFVNMLVGIMFWLFLLAGIAGQVILARKKKKQFESNRTRRIKLENRVGAVLFFRNIPACIADATLILSFIALIIALVITSGTGYSCYVFTSLFVFSFCMHCILNGKIYFFLTNQHAILRTTEPRFNAESEKE